MEVHSPNEDPINFCQDLKNFALRVAQVKGDDLITEADSEMIKEIKLIATHLEFPGSFSVDPPTHWGEIEDFGSLIQESLSIFLEENPNPASLVKFDRYLCTSTSPVFESRIVFLYRICTIHNLNCTALFLRNLADCMEFTQDSLSFNFFAHFHIPEEEHFSPLFIKILQFFHSCNLKELSIVNLLAFHSSITAEILKLIDSN